MRNDNNQVKIERSSSISQSRESIKENSEPANAQKRRSPDEGIQTAEELDSARTSKRSNSIEVITARVVEIDITSDDIGKMPPPAMVPKKAAQRKPRTKQKAPVVEPVPAPLRVTRSKIKQEKVSLPAAESKDAENSDEDLPLASLVAQPSTNEISQSQSDASNVNSVDSMSANKSAAQPVKKPKKVS